MQPDTTSAEQLTTPQEVTPHDRPRDRRQEAAPGREVPERAKRAGDVVEAAADSRPMGWLGRAGLIARGVIYLLMGAVALLLAFGSTSKDVDPKGALAVVIHYPAGKLLVIALTVGFAGYAVWRFLQAAFDIAAEGDGWFPRLQSLGSGILYGLLAHSAVTLLLGSRSSQSDQQESLAQRLMGLGTGGRVLVALAGIFVFGVAAYMAVDGLRCRFLRLLNHAPRSVLPAIKQIGRIGTVGRSAVFLAVGALVVYSAWSYEPEKAAGLDATLETLLQQAYGRPLVGLAAAALLTFGVFGLIEAKYRRT